jgi:hypothetical protein
LVFERSNINIDKTRNVMENPSVCGVALQDYLIEMEEFHGGRSPGMPGHGILFRDTGE